MTALFDEVRYACRSMTRSPGFAAILIGVLGLGIGANTAVFSVVNSILLHPTGIRQPDRLVVPRVKYAKLHLGAISLSPRDFGDLRQTRGVFSASTAISTSNLNYTGASFPVRLRAAAVTHQFFDVFGVKPRLGRSFYPEEDLPNRNGEAILSDGLWRRLFGADPAVIGRRALFNGESFEIVGVMPPEFQYPTTAELWMPLGLPPSQYSTGIRWDETLLVVARLSGDANFQQAATAINLLSGQVLASEYREIGPDGWGLFAVPFLTFNNAGVRSYLLILMVAVGLVLLIACSNMVGFMLARASHHSREYAVRVALGASRWHILGQSLAECSIISIGGGALGLMLGIAASHLLLVVSPQQFSQGLVLHTDVFVLGFTAGVAALAAILTGVAPGLYMCHVSSLHNHLTQRGASPSRQRLRSALLGAELALALTLLVGAGIFLRSLVLLQQVYPGYDPSGLLTAQLALPTERFKSGTSRAAFYREVLDRVRALPGVTDAAWVAGLPLTRLGGSGSFDIKGHPPLTGQPWPHGYQRYVTPGFLHVLRLIFYSLRRKVAATY
jgi:predicted permease